ncbi:hypothetical protein [Halocatena marina]|uniref:DUF4268 domain-containing protein n=1 Tax=Halocatena marina TaxID=2934937 RepID=A0ABD5YNX9_9EURY|nr:hypothetical protein [Halocatena marina]
MVNEMRVRFGRLGSPEDELPTPRDLYDAIDDTFRTRDDGAIVVEGEAPIPLDEKGMDPYYSNEHGDHSFCQFTYVAEKENSATVRDGNEVKVAKDEQPATLSVFYFRNGQFAYEPTVGLVKHWVPQFIRSRTGSDVDDSFFEFSQKTMWEFYDDSDEITLFKFGSVDEEFDGSTSFAQALNELTETVSSLEFSGGNPPEDLKGLELLDEAAEKMHIHRLKGKKDDGFTTQILATGMKQVKWKESDWPAEEKQERQAEIIYQKIAPYLRKFE